MDCTFVYHREDFFYLEDVDMNRIEFHRGRLFSDSYCYEGRSIISEYCEEETKKFFNAMKDYYEKTPV